MEMVPNKGKQAPRKGNGKPKEQSKTNLTKQGVVVKKEPTEPVEIKENTLTFPLLKTADNGRLMPRYTSIINRTEEEGVRFEDLDILKIELKGLLANVSVRVRVLQGELKNLTSATEDKKDKKRQIMDKAPASPAKRGKYDDKPIKKLKENPLRGREPMSSPPSIKITRVKSIQVHGPVPPSAALPPEPEPPRIITPRNDNPSKFWQSLEQYCCDITPNDIKFLEESVRCREKGPELPPIPSLGEHFSSRWKKDDINTEQEASSSNDKRTVAPSTSNLVGKRIVSKSVDANGPFTQRLVSALIEDNIISSKEVKGDAVCKDGENITPMKKIGTSSSSVSLEKIVMKELEEQGLIEKDSQPKPPQNDEIMLEIHNVQNEVSSITAYNCKMLKQVLHMAREQLPRQELKKKLKIVDNEVCEVFKKLRAAKLKETLPSESDKEQARRIMSMRERLVGEFNEIGIYQRTPIFYNVREVFKKFAAAKLKKRLPSKREKEQAWRVLRERDYLMRQLYGSLFKTPRGSVRPQATQARPPPEKVTVLKPPMGKGPVDKSRLTVQEKQLIEKPSLERQSHDSGAHAERKNFEKVLEKPLLEKSFQGKARTENHFSKPSCAPIVKPPLENPPMDTLLP